MPNAKAFKVRIKSVSNTKKITRAMQLIAAAKLKKFTDKIASSRAVLKIGLEMLANLEIEKDSHPLTRQNTKARNSLLVVIASDRGLCGGYNSKMVKFAASKREPNQEVHIIGKKLLIGLKDQVSSIDEANHLEDSVFRKELVENWISRYKKGEFRSVKLLFTSYKSAFNQTPIELPVLPFDSSALLGMEGDFAVETEEATEFEFEPNQKEVIEKLFPMLLEAIINYAADSAKASEESSRMMAMQTASNSAGDILDELQLKYNKARQAAVTQEITEIVSGVNALQS